MSLNKLIPEDMSVSKASLYPNNEKKYVADKMLDIRSSLEKNKKLKDKLKLFGDGPIYELGDYSNGFSPTGVYEKNGKLYKDINNIPRELILLHLDDKITKWTYQGSSKPSLVSGYIGDNNLGKTIETANIKNAEEEKKGGVTKKKDSGLTFAQPYALPQAYQDLYMQMSQGENKDYNFKAGRTGDTGTDALTAFLEGFTGGAMKSLNKKVTGYLGEQEFDKKIKPGLEKITGKKYDALPDEEKNRMTNQFNELMAKTEKTPEDVRQIDYLKSKAAYDSGSGYNATGQDVGVQKQISAQDLMFKQQLAQEIEKLRTIAPLEYAEWKKKQDYLTNSQLQYLKQQMGGVSDQTAWLKSNVSDPNLK